MGCAVEAHVFKEVGQTALVVILEDRAHFLGYVKFGLTFGILVVANVIGETIVQLPYAYLRIGIHRGQLLRYGYGRQQHYRYEKKREKSCYFLHVVNVLVYNVFCFNVPLKSVLFYSMFA